jgi:predicted amidohydrolase YtcJ
VPPDDPNSAAAAATLQATAVSADLVLRNARIFTGDAARPHAAVLAVSHGRITAVGEEADVAALIGPDTRVIDALGRRVIPGLSDSHIHLIRGGVNYLLELRWDGVPSLSVALQMLREQAERTPAGQWVRVVGERRAVRREASIDRFLAIFDKLAAEGLFPNGTRWFFDHAETVSPRAL